MYINIKSLWCTHETNRILYVNYMSIKNYLISIPMAYPVMNHSVCFAVLFRSNVLSITRLNYIVQWKYKHKCVIGITIDHFIGEIILNNLEPLFHQRAHLLYLLLLPPLLEWNKACMCTGLMDRLTHTWASCHSEVILTEKSRLSLNQKRKLHRRKSYPRRNWKNKFTPGINSA